VARCWTLAVAPQLADLRADPPLRVHLDARAVTWTEGALTAGEQREYGAYVATLELLGLLQAEGPCDAGTPPGSLSGWSGYRMSRRSEGHDPLASRG
jgi:hypothetical protein